MIKNQYCIDKVIATDRSRFNDFSFIYFSIEYYFKIPLSNFFQNSCKLLFLSLSTPKWFFPMLDGTICKIKYSIKQYPSSQGSNAKRIISAGVGLQKEQTQMEDSCFKIRTTNDTSLWGHMSYQVYPTRVTSSLPLLS